MNTQKTSALVIGEALVDIVEHADHSVPTQEVPGGSPANVALGLGRMGRPVRLATWLARDRFGTMCYDHLHASGVCIQDEYRQADTTSTAAALIGENGAATYTFTLDFDPPHIDIAPEDIVVHAGSIASIMEPGAQQVKQALREARATATVTYDPNARPNIMESNDAERLAQGQPTSREMIVELIMSADVVKASDEDIQWLTGSTDYATVVSQWLSNGPRVVVVTRGPQGVEGWVKDSGAHVSLPAPDVPVVDTVGAGDTLMAGLIEALWSRDLLGASHRDELGRIDEETLTAILREASAMSAVTISRAGADLPWRNELEH